MAEIRVAQRDDADDIARAHTDAWRVAYRGRFPDSYLDADDFATSRLERWRAWTWKHTERAELFVSLVDGRVVGFGHAGPARMESVCDQTGINDLLLDDTEETTCGEVYGFYLHPEAWGSGAAPALMARCVRFLRAEGFERAVLWVLRDNPRARAFYEKTGWQATGAEMMFTAPMGGQELADPVPEVQYAVEFA